MMFFNDRRKSAGVNNLNDQKIMRKKGPFDLRNSPKTLRKNVSKVSMEGAYGVKTEQPGSKNEWK